MSQFNPPWYLSNGHIQTILSGVIRSSVLSHYDERIRITLPDSDFIDIDMKYVDGKSIVFILHGLESSSESSFVKNLSYGLANKGFNIAAINFRGCSGEPNKLYKSYHSGCWKDIDYVLTELCSRHDWESFYGIGCSLGGSVLLNLGYYLGKIKTPYTIKKMAAISVPLHLESCAITLNKPINTLYMFRFIKKYQRKIKAKSDIIFSLGLDIDDLLNVHSFYEIDEKYTAPAHGFSDAQDYWETCSTLTLLNDITIPTAILNSKDDPFLSSLCYPSVSNKHIQTKYPLHGGHLGFIDQLAYHSDWHEREIASFFLN